MSALRDASTVLHSHDDELPGPLDVAVDDDLRWPLVTYCAACVLGYD
ncbi:hypothetical protein ACH3VR_16780 [Microbacterium sp. B2969]|uniref:Uncharacterized protein n=1 Tax=Microbacterium alkaliflavum TaxID=3248839 RepID=A0ABW7QAV0_9MICO